MIEIAKGQLESMEKILTQNVDLDGFTLTDKDSSKVHFSTHTIEQEAIVDNQIATYTNTALMMLKSKWNLTRWQMRDCVKSMNISTLAFCTQKVYKCDPSR